MRREATRRAGRSAHDARDRKPTPLGAKKHAVIRYCSVLCFSLLETLPETIVMHYIQAMARPTKAVKTKLDPATGRYMVAFREAPTRYHATPEADEARAIKWAERNKNRLLAEEVKPLLFRNMAPDFSSQPATGTPTGQERAAR